MITCVSKQERGSAADFSLVSMSTIQSIFAITQLAEPFFFFFFFQEGDTTPVSSI